MTQTISLNRFSAAAKRVMVGAQKLADEMHHEQAGSLHFLVRLLEEETARGVCSAVGADPAVLVREAQGELALVPVSGEGKSRLALDVLDLLRRAEREAGSGEVEIRHLLHALAQEERGPVRAILTRANIKPGVFRTVVGDAEVDDERGEAVFRDFASEVRSGLDEVEDKEVRDRGRKLINRLASQLVGQSGIPGLRLERETETRFKLERLPKDADVVVAFESETGAVSITKRKGVQSTVARYVWSRFDQRWARVDGKGVLYDDLRDVLRECLYPELKA